MFELDSTGRFRHHKFYFIETIRAGQQAIAIRALIQELGGATIPSIVGTSPKDYKHVVMVLDELEESTTTAQTSTAQNTPNSASKNLRNLKISSNTLPNKTAATSYRMT